MSLPGRAARVVSCAGALCPVQNSPAQPLPACSQMRRPSKEGAHSSHCQWEESGSGRGARGRNIGSSLEPAFPPIDSHSQNPLLSRCPRPPPARCPCPRSPLGPRPHLSQACADLPLRASWGPCQPGICWWCWAIPSGKPGPVIRLEAALQPTSPAVICARHGHCAPRYSYTSDPAGVCQCVQSRQSQRRSRYCKPCTPPSSTVAAHPDLVPVSSLAPELGLAGSGQAQDCSS